MSIKETESGKVMRVVASGTGSYRVTIPKELYQKIGSPKYVFIQADTNHLTIQAVELKAVKTK